MALAASTSSCVKDELFDTPHPTSGALVVTTDWAGRSNNAVIPRDYVIRIGDHWQQVEGITNTFDRLLTPGKHTMLIYNRPECISISGTNA